MSTIYNIELNRAFKSRRFWCAICIGTLIVSLHLILWLPGIVEMNEKLMENSAAEFPITSYFGWICGNTITWQQYLYFILVPLIATMPFGYSLFEDRDSAFMKQIIIKSGKKDYYRAKFLAVFLSGGVVTLIPLLFNLVVSMMFLPSLCPDVISNNYSVTTNTMFSGIFYSHPNLYILIYMIIDFIFGGLFASIALVVSELTEHKYVVEIAPLFIGIFVNSVFGLMEEPYYAPVYFMNCSFPIIRWYGVFGEMLILLIISYGYVLWKGKKDEVF